MRIGLVNEYFPPFAPGGAEWSTVQLARELAKGHRVVVITPNYGAPSREERDNYVVYRYPFPARLSGGQRTLSYRYQANPLQYLWAAVSVAHIARAERLEVLHAQNKFSLPGAWLASRWTGTPVVFTLRDYFHICPLGGCLMWHDTVPKGCGRGRLWREDVAYHLANYVQPENWLAHRRARLSLEWLRFDTTIRRWFLARADGVVSVSESTLEIHRQAGLRLGSSARVIHNLPPAAEPVTADDLATLRERFCLDGGPIVLFAGRLSPGKGVPDLLSAAPKVAARVPGVQVVLAGPGNIVTSDPHVRMLGAIPHETVMGLYHLADVVVVPSVWPEPLSRVILEAMATGRPVVATAVGGTPEMISHGENGLLVPRNDPRQLAEAIVAILIDHKLRTRMGIASRHIVDECFGSARSLDQLVDIYESLGAQR